MQISNTKEAIDSLLLLSVNRLSNIAGITPQTILTHKVGSVVLKKRLLSLARQLPAEPLNSENKTVIKHYSNAIKIILKKLEK